MAQRATSLGPKPSLFLFVFIIVFFPLLSLFSRKKNFFPQKTHVWIFFNVSLCFSLAFLSPHVSRSLSLSLLLCFSSFLLVILVCFWFLVLVSVLFFFFFFLGFCFMKRTTSKYYITKLFFINHFSCFGFLSCFSFTSLFLIFVFFS